MNYEHRCHQDKQSSYALIHQKRSLFGPAPVEEYVRMGERLTTEFATTISTP